MCSSDLLKGERKGKAEEKELIIRNLLHFEKTLDESSLEKI